MIKWRMSVASLLPFTSLLPHMTCMLRRWEMAGDFPFPEIARKTGETSSVPAFLPCKAVGAGQDLSAMFRSELRLPCGARCLGCRLLTHSCLSGLLVITVF